MSGNDLDRALEALAAAEGRSVDELKAELLRERLQRHAGTGAAPARAPLARRGPSALAREPEEIEFPGSPVVRTTRDDYETSAEAQERWYNEEAELIDGVHGWGGQSSGGIFGDGPIATEEYDPQAEMRAERRTATHAQAQQAVALTQLSRGLEVLMDRLGVPQHPSQNILPGVGRRQLGRGRRR